MLSLIPLVTISLQGTYLSTNCGVTLEYMLILGLPWKLKLAVAVWIADSRRHGCVVEQGCLKPDQRQRLLGWVRSIWSGRLYDSIGIKPEIWARDTTDIPTHTNSGKIVPFMNVVRYLYGLKLRQWPGSCESNVIMYLQKQNIGVFWDLFIKANLNKRSICVVKRCNS